MNTEIKKNIIIILLVLLLGIREYKHTERKINLKNHYEEEIAIIQDMAADACDDRISEILGQF